MREGLKSESEKKGLFLNGLGEIDFRETEDHPEKKSFTLNWYSALRQMRDEALPLYNRSPNGAFAVHSFYTIIAMKQSKDRKPGRPGRTTKMVNLKLLNTVALRLKLAATTKRPQRAIVEHMLDVALPPLPATEAIPPELAKRFLVTL